MNDPIYHRLREAAQRRKLTPAEEVELRACLAANPEARIDWELEQGLNGALERVPDVPVATNFTARVLQGIERDDAARPVRAPSKWSWRSLVPRLAFVAVLVGTGFLMRHASLAAKRVQLARSVMAVSGIASLPGPEVLEDFEAIRQLNPTVRTERDLRAFPQPFATTNNPLSPPLPKLVSPVALFRELLAMSPAERRLALTNRPAEARKQILAKLREYASLKPEEREWRLRATELQWYLLPLMSVAPTNRAARLALIPDEERKLVEERLERWDRLPPHVQQEMLNNEMAARYFAQLKSGSKMPPMSPASRAKLEAGLDRWRGFSEEQRQTTLESFNAFFELTRGEKEKALKTLSNLEQRQMEKTLEAYSKLSTEQRRQCILSFEKFAGMSLEDRQSFLKNAERWKLMSVAERDTWRKLVSYAPLQPPLPARVPPRPQSTQ